MSSYVRTGATTPPASCTFGPAGTVASAGGAPRRDGIVWQIITRLCATQSHGDGDGTPAIARPAISLACALFVSAIHSEMPFSRVRVKANRLPSAENPTGSMVVPAG